MATMTRQFEVFKAYIKDKVENQPDPFLIRAVLRGINNWRFDEPTKEALSSALQVPEADLQSIINFLENEELIKSIPPFEQRKVTTFKATDEGNWYCHNSPEYADPAWKGLTPEETITLFSTIAPYMTKTQYSKNIMAPGDVLRPLQVEIESKVKELQAIEQETLRKKLGLPVGSTFSLSFVKTHNPTSSSRYGPVDGPEMVYASPNYASIEDAVTQKTDEIHMRDFKINQSFTLGGKEITTYPLHIEARYNELYDVRMNSAYGEIWTLPVSYNRLGMEKKAELTSIIDSVVKDKRSE
jgi:hypothetical protein